MAYRWYNGWLVDEEEFEYMKFLDAMAEAELKRKVFAILGLFLAVSIGIVVSYFFAISYWITISVGIFLGLKLNGLFSFLFRILMWIFIIGWLALILLPDIKLDVFQNINWDAIWDSIFSILD